MTQSARQAVLWTKTWINKKLSYREREGTKVSAHLKQKRNSYRHEKCLMSNATQEALRVDLSVNGWWKAWTDQWSVIAGCRREHQRGNTESSRRPPTKISWNCLEFESHCLFVQIHLTCCNRQRNMNISPNSINHTFPSCHSDNSEVLKSSTFGIIRLNSGKNTDQHKKPKPSCGYQKYRRVMFPADIRCMRCVNLVDHHQKPSPLNKVCGFLKCSKPSLKCFYMKSHGVACGWWRPSNFQKCTNSIAWRQSAKMKLRHSTRIAIGSQ